MEEMNEKKPVIQRNKLSKSTGKNMKVRIISSLVLTAMISSFPKNKERSGISPRPDILHALSRFCRHKAVNLRIFGNLILERNQSSSISNQTGSGCYIGDIFQLPVREVQ